MARSSSFTKEEIINAALELTREQGFGAVTARAIGKKLGTSYRPICSYFQSMAQLHQSVIAAANGLFQSYLREDMASGKYPPYKASGMAYIRFAGEEKELFKLLFMRNREKGEKSKLADEADMLVELIRKQVELSQESARMFYLEMWAYVHGIAVMTATDFYDWSEELCSQTLTDMYQGLKYKYENQNGTEASKSSPQV